jgi:hypothetical protein
MDEPVHSTARHTGLLDATAVAQGVGTLYLFISGLVAAEMSGVLSIVLLALAVSAAVGTVFLRRRRRWAWWLSLSLAALFTLAGLAMTFFVLWVGVIHATAGALVLAALWVGRPALVD